MTDVTDFLPLLTKARDTLPETPTMRDIYNVAQHLVGDDEIMYRYMVEELVSSHPPESIAAFDGDTPQIRPVDWDELWNREVTQEWTCEPFLPKGRLVALYAAGKAGKSLLALEVAAALATGTHTLDQPEGDPIDVLYIDQEMTIDDLQQRIEDLGYTPDDDMSHLHYYQLQTWDPFDTDTGADQLVTLVQRIKPKLLILDTVARVVEGAENDADTYRNLYRTTLQPIKAMGITILRIDHAGKDLTKGQRGSSAKNDDVDVVWMLIQDTQTKMRLVCDRRRINWIPMEVLLERTDNTAGFLRHLTSGITLTVTQQQLVELLDEAKAPIQMSRRKARETYPFIFRNVDYGPAQKYRRIRGIQPEPEPEAPTTERLPYKDGEDEDDSP